ncbi:MAG: adenylyltransferase/cytidyltransferase family protein [Myxococcales bacterium]|nr:adenylyltransferase/cytidyltransferase family protein [Myxococcales bacterium]
MIVGLTSGCFDLVHYGHVLYLERCRKLCDKLIVGVDDDQMVAQWKGAERPIIPELERLEMINNLACVDSAFLLHELGDLARVVRQFRVDKVFKHQGFAKLDHVVGVDDTDAELVIVPDVPGLVSTSEIISRIRQRYGSLRDSEV